MKTRLAVLATVVAMVVAGIGDPAEARRPLVGEMDLQFNLAWSGPSETVPDWVGTITIDEVEYGMAFFNTGNGKPFAEHPGPNVFFEETWVIYDELDLEFNPAGEVVSFEPGEVVLAGYDAGITTVKNSKYHMNGYVHDAEGDFAHWMGRSVHMMGLIEWYPFGAPQFAPGVFRIN